MRIKINTFPFVYESKSSVLKGNTCIPGLTDHAYLKNFGFATIDEEMLTSFSEMIFASAQWNSSLSPAIAMPLFSSSDLNFL